MPTKGAIRVAQESEEDSRGRLEESGDPLAELKQQEWGNAIQTLRALDPNNPNLSYIVPQDWVPTDQNIADLNAEIAKVAAQRATDFVMPGGNFTGEQGNGPDVRILPGGEQAAQEAFDYLSVGGKPYSGSYPQSGQMVVLPGSTGWVGLRTNRNRIPTLDIRVPSAHSVRYGSITNETAMKSINEVVDGFLRESVEDYIGLWAIAPAVRRDLALESNEEVKARTLDVVRILLGHGLFAGDYDYGVAFHPWEGFDTDSTIARIDKEWDASRGDPTLPESICWFDAKRT